MCLVVVAEVDCGPDFFLLTAITFAWLAPCLSRSDPCERRKFLLADASTFANSKCACSQTHKQYTSSTLLNVFKNPTSGQLSELAYTCMPHNHVSHITPSSSSSSSLFSTPAAATLLGCVLHPPGAPTSLVRMHMLAPHPLAPFCQPVLKQLNTLKSQTS